jgi:hypothetical protein
VGLPHLKSLPNLQRVDLMYTRITDAGLQHLMQIRTLQQARVWGTQLSPNGRAALMASMLGNQTPK